MIKDRTKLSSRTVKYALKALVRKDLVRERKSFTDMRQKLYSFCPWL
jgi:DNA-binding MarR family transcriptional regulator